MEIIKSARKVVFLRALARVLAGLVHIEKKIPIMYLLLLNCTLVVCTCVCTSKLNTHYYKKLSNVCIVSKDILYYTGALLNNFILFNVEGLW